MFDFLKSIINTVVKDIEAKLRPTATCQYGGRGEVEFEVYSDDSAELEIELKRAVILDGTEVVVLCSNQVLATVNVHGGRIKEKIHFEPGQSLPMLEIGDKVVFEIEGVACYQGVFRRD